MWETLEDKQEVTELWEAGAGFEANHCNAILGPVNILSPEKIPLLPFSRLIQNSTKNCEC